MTGLIIWNIVLTVGLVLSLFYTFKATLKIRQKSNKRYSDLKEEVDSNTKAVKNYDCDKLVDRYNRKFQTQINQIYRKLDKKIDSGVILTEIPDEDDEPEFAEVKL